MTSCRRARHKPTKLNQRCPSMAASIAGTSRRAAPKRDARPAAAPSRMASHSSASFASAARTICGDSPCSIVRRASSRSVLPSSRASHSRPYSPLNPCTPRCIADAASRFIRPSPSSSSQYQTMSSQPNATRQAASRSASTMPPERSPYSTSATRRHISAHDPSPPAGAPAIASAAPPV